MNEAIERRVEEFVQEILGMIALAGAEHRATLVDVATAALGAVGERPTSRPPTSRRARKMQPPETSPGPRQGPVHPEAVAAPSPSSRSTAAIQAAPQAAPVSDREATVLAAVRALGHATAGEVASHTGQPNGSVAVTLRALVARGLVARAETGRGVEYSLPAAERRA